MSDSVTRYVPTYMNKQGMRTLVFGAQGRWTLATPEEAQSLIDAMRTNNDPQRMRDLYGPTDTLEVRPVECWPGHFDPKGVWFD